MATIDLIINSVLFLAPVVVAFIIVSRNKGEVSLFGLTWAGISVYIVYRMPNYAHDIFLFIAYYVTLFFLVVWGIRHLIARSIEERSRLISSIPKSFILRAIREACNEIDNEWICEAKARRVLKSKDAMLEIGLLKLKNVTGVYLKSKPLGRLINKIALSAIGFLLLTLYMLIDPNESYLIIMNYPLYLPVISFILGIYALYMMFRVRNSILRNLSVAMIITRNKLKAAEKLHETLKIIAMAEAVKRKIAKQKIKEVAELAKTLDIAERIRKKNESN